MKAPLRASQLRERIIIQQPGAKVSDGAGGYQDAPWADLFETRAFFGISANYRFDVEQENNGGVISTPDQNVFIRYYAEALTIRAGMRMVDKTTSRIYRINTPAQDQDGLQHFLFFRVTLEQPN